MIATKTSGVVENHCGDQTGYWEFDGKVVLCIIDGLGHGKGAEHAALAALDFVAGHYQEPLIELFAHCDTALHDTRGVAMGIVVADPDAGSLTYGGIGNTRMMIVGDETTRLTSNYGIVGAGYRKLVPQSAPLAPGDMVMLYTDGIEELVDMSRYDEGLRTDLERLAGTILEDWRRPGDDAGIVVFRNGG